jgi:hypothetical protein
MRDRGAFISSFLDRPAWDSGHVMEAGAYRKMGFREKHPDSLNKYQYLDEYHKVV